MYPERMDTNTSGGKGPGVVHIQFDRGYAVLQLFPTYHKVHDCSIPVRKLILQNIAEPWRMRVNVVSGTDRDKAELLFFVRRTLGESNEEYLRTTLGSMIGGGLSGLGYSVGYFICPKVRANCGSMLHTSELLFFRVYCDIQIRTQG